MLDAKLLKLFTRPVLDEKGRPEMKKTKSGEEPVTRELEADEVLDFAVRESGVTVVTVDGRKFTAPLPKGYKLPSADGEGSDGDPPKSES